MTGECIDHKENPGLRVEPNFIDEREEQDTMLKLGTCQVDKHVWFTCSPGIPCLHVSLWFA